MIGRIAATAFAGLPCLNLTAPAAERIYFLDNVSPVFIFLCR